MVIAEGGRWSARAESVSPGVPGQLGGAPGHHSFTMSGITCRLFAAALQAPSSLGLNPSTAGVNPYSTPHYPPTQPPPPTPPTASNHAPSPPPFALLPGANSGSLAAVAAAATMDDPIKMRGSGDGGTSQRVRYSTFQHAAMAAAAAAAAAGSQPQAGAARFSLFQPQLMVQAEAALWGGVGTGAVAGSADKRRDFVSDKKSRGERQRERFTFASMILFFVCMLGRFLGFVVVLGRFFSFFFSLLAL